jgi:hypothetical protein
MKTKRYLISALLIVGAAAGAFSLGGVDEYEREFARMDSFSLVTGSIPVAVHHVSRDYRMAATLNTRRTVDVRERGHNIAVTVSKTPGWTPSARPERIDLYLPDDINLAIEVGSGRVTISGFTLERLDVRTGSGAISVEDVAGPMEVRTGSGSVTIRGCDGDKEIGVGSGSISVIDSDGSIDSGSASGSHEYREIDGDISVEAGSGSVTLDEVQGIFEITANSGRIAGEEIRLEGSSRFESNSGAISISFLNEGEDLRFDLSAGSGSLRVNDTRGSSRLAIGSGSIEVTGNSGSGSQRYETR